MNTTRYSSLTVLCSLLLHLLAAGTAQAQDYTDPSARLIETAPVRVDGQVLMQVRGVTAYPAQERARQFRKNILAVARDKTTDPAELRLSVAEDRATIKAGDFTVLTLVEADAKLEGVPLSVLAEVTLNTVTASISKFRQDRSPDALKLSAVYFAALTGVLLLALWLLRRFKAWLNRLLETRITQGIAELERKSKRFLRGAHLWKLVEGAVNVGYLLLLLLLGYFYLNSVLGSFPWTRGFALYLLHMVMNPLSSIARGLIASVPNLVFLAILFLLVRYLLRMMNLFFRSVERGQLQITNFEAEWALPTYRILRIAVVAFAVVVAYPYIPGSDSAAFKGVSLFLGVVVSLGSTSFIANMIAGMTMTYRGAYRVGDWVRIGDQEGQVEDSRMMVMRLRTRKNESVTIPNSVILNQNVTNYSAQGRTEGLVLHTEVSIGYDTPWRQVEAMLTEAARRTEGVLANPAPFVQHKQLGDFAVHYELNAVVTDPSRMPGYYTALHRNILDVFNEHGVQIMSPRYVADPEEPKVAPPEPAQPE